MPSRYTSQRVCRYPHGVRRLSTYKLTANSRLLVLKELVAHEADHEARLPHGCITEEHELEVARCARRFRHLADPGVFPTLHFPAPSPSLAVSPPKNVTAALHRNERDAVATLATPATCSRSTTALREISPQQPPFTTQKKEQQATFQEIAQNTRSSATQWDLFRALLRKAPMCARDQRAAGCVKQSVTA